MSGLRWCSTQSWVTRAGGVPGLLPASLRTLMRRGGVQTDGWASGEIPDYGSLLQMDWILLAPTYPQAEIFTNNIINNNIIVIIVIITIIIIIMIIIIILHLILRKLRNPQLIHSSVTAPLLITLHIFTTPPPNRLYLHKSRSPGTGRHLQACSQLQTPLMTFKACPGAQRQQSVSHGRGSRF